jgi:hypothetical protein
VPHSGTLPTDIRLDWKGLAGTNTLAYYGRFFLQNVIFQLSLQVRTDFERQAGHGERPIKVRIK